MAGTGLTRTDYWNRVTGSVRTGDTRRDETVTDIEDFLLPYGQAVTAGLHLWGIADGLQRNRHRQRGWAERFTGHRDRRCGASDRADRRRAGGGGSRH